ncbi:HlyD family efflux transporter periplasmic adaptor subunit [Alteromonas sp. BMJM2]|uniref:HlyD family efflux transporter periplasmic adaptor subunit n=1 Tax=Alteromonas sp. BMJM2 TaxID=2954241 RepID=UPI0022B5444B|nr:HlyD family efflux transporter periplasmic adaptor subunit [Alteromonas sp. BMJM2]
MAESDIFESDPVEDIVGRAPSWIVKSGTALLFSVFSILLVLTWFIKYPDTIDAPIILTSKKPPVELLSRVDARIVSMFVVDEQLVDKGTPLLLLDSDVNLQDVLRLESALVKLRASFSDNSIERFSEYTTGRTAFGQLQPSVKNLFNAVNQYMLFIQSRSLENQIISNKTLLKRYISLHEQLQSKKKTQLRKLSIEKNNYNRNKELIDRGVIAQSSLVSLENRFLDRNLSLDDLNIQLELNRVKQEEISSDTLQTSIKLEEQKRTFLFNIEQALLGLESEITAWKRDYLVVAPIAGKVSFANYWSSNQQIQRGDVALVVYSDTTEMIGKLYVDHLGAGKIKHDQRVSIELASYPSLEFGKVFGTVSRISNVPGKKGYAVDVTLPENLITSYHQALPYSPKMVGAARIITQDRRLVERFFDKVIYAFEET